MTWQLLPNLEVLETANHLIWGKYLHTKKAIPSLQLLYDPRSAVLCASPGRGLPISRGYLHPDKGEHSEVQDSPARDYASRLDLPLISKI